MNLSNKLVLFSLNKALALHSAVTFNCNLNCKAQTAVSMAVKLGVTVCWCYCVLVLLCVGKWGDTGCWNCVTFHMTLHVAVARCQSGSPPKNPEKAKHLVCEIKLVDGETGAVWVSHKPNDHLLTGGKSNKAMWVWAETDVMWYLFNISVFYFVC